MRIVETAVSERDGQQRTTAVVQLGDGTREEYWFEGPGAGAAGHSGDAWAIALLPLAMTRGEVLELSLPVDPVLLRNLDRLQAIWTVWYPSLAIIEVQAPPAPLAAPAPGPVASCFSGGVDSFYTLLHNHARFPQGDVRRISALMLVHGADVPVDDEETFGKLRARYGTLAAELGVTLHAVRTNYRSGPLGRLSWGGLTHAACLAACASSLGEVVGSLLIASGAAYWSSHAAHGSTPLTDPLFSSSRLRVEHDGGERSRPEKIEYIAGNPAVRSHLRVCWRLKNDRNCGRCAKCLRTMAALDAVDQLDAFSGFPRDHYTPASLAKVYCRNASEYRQLRLVYGHALARGRRDLTGPLGRAFGRSERLQTLLLAADLVDRALSVDRLSRFIERRVRRASILD